ncbi:MAG: peptide-methionine (S)-S-oxide reductase MsrA [Leptothrix sp. (in: b-proteobacteria)]
MKTLTESSRFSTSRRLLGAVALLVVGAVAWQTLPAWAGDAAVVIPPPLDGAALAAGAATADTAVFAGGCFWGVQGVFQHVKGVTRAVSGYAGGEARTARYDAVGSGSTGHAEAVRISFDPQQISYGQLLQIYFSVAHDPTELNRQGPDTGTQYRSTVFAQNAEQARVARAYIAQLDQARSFSQRIATTVELQKPFFEAEVYHQDYLTLHPNQPYIVINDLPKVENLKRVFPNQYRAAPVLVGANG